MKPKGAVGLGSVLDFFAVTMWPFDSSKRNLQRAARDLVPLLLDRIEEWQPEFLALFGGESEIEEISPTLQTDLTLEVPVLCLYLVDRSTFKEHGATGRAVFMDALLEGVSREYGRRRGAKVVGQLIELFNKRIFQYAKYPTLADRTGSRGTLCGEFAWTMAAKYTGRANPIVITYIKAFMMDTLIRLHKTGILKTPNDAFANRDGLREEPL